MPRTSKLFGSPTLHPHTRPSARKIRIVRLDTPLPFPRDHVGEYLVKRNEKRETTLLRQPPMFAVAAFIADHLNILVIDIWLLPVAVPAVMDSSIVCRRGEQYEQSNAWLKSRHALRVFFFVWKGGRVICGCLGWNYCDVVSEDAEKGRRRWWCNISNNNIIYTVHFPTGKRAPWAYHDK